MSRAISAAAIPSTSTAQSLLPINRWFVWKEVRQLLPLMVALLLAAAAMLFIQSQMFTSWNRVSPLAILVFPGLFAVGAGTVLVGQEREQRTMDWLTTLPIPSRNLILIKFVVALAGLALMWLFALVALTITGIGHDYASQWLTFRSGRIAANHLMPVSYPLWLAHSAFVMLCSFFASWRIRNQFVALIVIAPLACIPLLLCEFVLEGFYSSTGQQLKMATTAWVRLIGTLVSVPVMGLLTYRMAMRVLAPQLAPKYRFVSPLQSLTGTPRETQSVISQAPQFGSQITSIIWQSIHSAPLLWSAFIAMMIVGTYLPIARIGSDGMLSQWLLFEPITFLSLLAVSWLGVSVFKNDGSATRLQFLADRGIRPTKIYLGRHAVPIAIMASGLIVYTLLATYQSTNRVPGDRSDRLPSMAAVMLLFAAIYSISQWTSQVVRMFIVAAIIAPILSIFVLNWWSIAASDLSAPTWMLFTFAAMPLLATWWLMPRYMDMRDRARSILLGIAIAFTMVALPVVSQGWQLYQVIRSTEVPNYETLLPLRAEGLAANETSPKAVRLLVRYYDAGNIFNPLHSSGEVPPELAMKFWNARAKTPDEFLPALSQLRDQPELAATIPADTWKALLNQLILQRLKFEESSTTKDASAIDTFGSWVEAASLIAESLRRHPKWYDQEVADRLEVWLVDTLNSAALAPHHDASFFIAAATRFPDTQRRQDARRAGVLSSWATWKYPTPEERKSFGLNRDPLVDRLAEQYYEIPAGNVATKLNMVVPVAINKLDSDGVSMDGLSWERRMHNALLRDQMPFELGPYAPRYRDLPSTMTIEGTILYPARYWGLAWEDQATALKQAFLRRDSAAQAKGDDK